jgi:hypothetical protein
MSAENVELFHKAIDCYNRRDLEAIEAWAEAGNPELELDEKEERTAAPRPTGASR